VSKGHLEPEQLVLISAAGEPVRGGCPSSEIKLHLAIYGALPDCNAVVHAHPITATAFAMEEKTIDTRANEEAATVLGDVALVPFAPSGSAELGRAIMPLLNGRSAFLLTRHGAVTLGSDLWEAFYRMETLERFARILAAQAKLPPK
jgi:L-fuculose-phosphate aldolase